MNEDLLKLINIAEGSGSLTSRQREIILRKAEKVGEDVDEVEMLLENIFRAKEQQIDPVVKSGGKKRCVNCGALVSETSLKCPECGCVLNYENVASSEARNQIANLQNQLSEATSINEQVILINTFTMPVTKEGLIQLLELSFSNYASIGTSEKDVRLEPIRNAWKGKCLQAYNALSRLGESEQDVQALLNRYKPLLKKEEKKKSANYKVKRIIIWVAILVAIPFLADGLYVLYDGFHVDRYWDSVHINECLQQHDYQGARTFAKSQNQKDEITEQEVSYLISLGEIGQAKTSALMIKDEAKREMLQERIREIEGQ